MDVSHKVQRREREREREIERALSLSLFLCSALFSAPLLARSIHTTSNHPTNSPSAPPSRTAQPSTTVRRSTRQRHPISSARLPPHTAHTLYAHDVRTSFIGRTIRITVVLTKRLSFFGLIDRLLGRLIDESSTRVFARSIFMIIAVIVIMLLSSLDRQIEVIDDS